MFLPSEAEEWNYGEYDGRTGTFYIVFDERGIAINFRYNGSGRRMESMFVEKEYYEQNNHTAYCNNPNHGRHCLLP